MKKYDRIILGAGMYGLYAASESTRKGYSVLVIDMEEGPFHRGSYINQARLHNGYHYPRSFSTASKSSHYFNRFMSDYEDCINSDFTKIYAVASEYSWANGQQFSDFCRKVNIPCDEIEKSTYFNPCTIDKAFLSKEYSFDAMLLKEKLYNFAKGNNCNFNFGISIKSIVKKQNIFVITLINGEEYETEYILNATYAGTNQIHNIAGYEMLPIKYELCEVILCNVSQNIKNIGLTVMDGPFFSLMPFGKTGYHSITTVSKTPHVTSYDSLPTFDCQEVNKSCKPECSANCNTCKAHPKSAFVSMAQTAKKYLDESIKVEFVKSLFTLKPILKTSEIDDSRPTIIRQYSDKPMFYTVFSGKINTIYDLDIIL